MLLADRREVRGDAQYQSALAMLPNPFAQELHDRHCYAIGSRRAWSCGVHQTANASYTLKFLHARR
jgi:hypothetical protein